MKTLTQRPSATRERRFGKISIRNSSRRHQEESQRPAEVKYVDWSPPINILQGLDYLKLEILVPGISKHDLKLCCTGLLLWMRIRKEDVENGNPGIFYRTFVLPQNTISEGVTAVYEQNEKLVITIPKKKNGNSSFESSN